MNMKKLFALLFCAAMLLCAVGCNKEPAPVNDPTFINNIEAAGVLFVSVGAEYKVIYDTEGKVLAVDGMTDAAADVLASYSTYSGTACDSVVSALVKQTVTNNKNGQNRVVVIKQAPGGKVPSAGFLEDVRADAAAVTDFEVVLITADALSAEGYISSDAAKDILTRQLKLTDVTMTCPEVENEVYTLTFELEGAEREYQVDAVTGTVLIQSFSGNPDFDPDFEEEFEGYIPDSETDSEDYYGGPIDPQ